MVWRWICWQRTMTPYLISVPQWRKGAEWGCSITVLQVIIIPDNWTFVIPMLWNYYPFVLYHSAIERKYFHKWRTLDLYPCQGLYSFKHRLTGTGIPIINLRWSEDRLRFIMWIPILIRRWRLLSESRPSWSTIWLLIPGAVRFQRCVLFQPSHVVTSL